MRLATLVVRSIQPTGYQDIASSWAWLAIQTLLKALHIFSPFRCCWGNSFNTQIEMLMLYDAKCFNSKGPTYDENTAEQITDSQSRILVRLYVVQLWKGLKFQRLTNLRGWRPSKLVSQMSFQYDSNYFQISWVFLFNFLLIVCILYHGTHGK